MSSQIEGTQATLEDVLDPTLDANTNRNVADVINYIKATEYAINRLHTLPLCNRLIKETHAVWSEPRKLDNQLEGSLHNVEVIGKDEMFGRTKMCIYYSNNKQDVLNFKKYSLTKFFKDIVEMIPQEFLYYLPNFDEIKRDINWDVDINEIEMQLVSNFNLF